jgi:hypothetical protein
MINVATDCIADLGPSDWRKMNRWQLELFAREGTAQQKASLTDWGYSGMPAWQFEELYFSAYGEEWQQD